MNKSYKPIIILAAIWFSIFAIAADTPKFLNSDNIDKSKVFHEKNPEGEFLRYFIVNDSSVSVVGSKGNYNAKTLTIPSVVKHNSKDYVVRYIQSFAFKTYVGRKYLRKVEEIFLPNTLELVGQNCFEGMPSLKTVTIPKSLKVLEYCMFSECPKLEEVFIPYDSKLLKFRI